MRLRGSGFDVVLRMTQHLRNSSGPLENDVETTCLKGGAVHRSLLDGDCILNSVHRIASLRIILKMNLSYQLSVTWTRSHQMEMSAPPKLRRPLRIRTIRDWTNTLQFVITGF